MAVDCSDATLKRAAFRVSLVEAIMSLEWASSYSLRSSFRSPGGGFDRTSRRCKLFIVSFLNQARLNFQTHAILQGADEVALL